MSTTNFVLFAMGVGGTTFAFWGFYTQAGQQNFDGMSGMIPFAAGVLGVLFLFLAILLAGYQYFFSPMAVAPVPPAFPDAPRYSEQNHWVLLLAVVAMLGLFDLFCRFTVGVSGILIAISWFEGTGSHWVLGVLFVFVLFLHALLASTSLVTIHARYFGQPERSVVVGHDLHNEVFRLYPAGEIVATSSAVHDDNDVFTDRFSDLRWEKTLRFGQRAEDTLGWQSFTQAAAIKAGLTHCLTLAILGLFFIGLIGWSVDYQGDLGDSSGRPLEDGFAWLWTHHRALFLGAVVSGTVAMIALAASVHDPKLVAQLQPDEVFAQLPDTIRSGAVIQGVVTDHTIEQLHFKNQSGPRISHYNVLVRLEGIFARPVWMRISLGTQKSVRLWLEGAVAQQEYAQPFVVQQDLSIMPQSLHGQRVGISGE